MVAARLEKAGWGAARTLKGLTGMLLHAKGENDADAA
jgi:hypothetical protein